MTYSVSGPLVLAGSSHTRIADSVVTLCTVGDAMSLGIPAVVMAMVAGPMLQPTEVQARTNTE